MTAVSLEVKQKHWKKKWDEAPFIECACGCGGFLKSVDRYGRPVLYLNGHNRRQYQVDGNPKTAAHKRWRNKNRETYRKGRTRRYRTKKLELMRMFNNTCNNCGLEYNENNAAIFEFHHEDPNIKDDLISAMIRNASFERVLDEVKKCVLLCAHCHIIHHQGSW